jgi:hypothetical protein
MALASQDNWRFCTKCYCLWWNGYPHNGICPAGGGHTALQFTGGEGGTSWNMALATDEIPYSGGDGPPGNQ